MFKLITKLKPYLGLIAIIYPVVQNLLSAKGINLPDLGEFGDFISVTSGATVVAKSEKI